MRQTSNVSVAVELHCLKEANKRMQDTLEKVERALYGDGGKEKGLLTNFELLASSVAQHHQEVEKVRKTSVSNWQWLVTTLIAASAVAVAFIK